jgi:prolipoprotein diacylglyceryltransferase
MIYYLPVLQPLEECFRRAFSLRSDKTPCFFFYLHEHPEVLDSAGMFFSLLGDTFGGMVFYGGLFGGIIGLRLYTRFLHKNNRLYQNAFAPAYALIHAFGRIGCFLTAAVMAFLRRTFTCSLS